MLALFMLGVAATAAPAHPQHEPAWNASKWTLVIMNEAVAKGAVCLDGSPGGYYIRPGTPNNSRWVVFHQGGGWCTNDEGCAARANTALGSSRHANKYSWGPTCTREASSLRRLLSTLQLSSTPSIATAARGVATPQPP
eukprot:m.211954 g.211954  ORF g.211954 m.211954 type:complete len:139 (+) comp15501_c0_seq1:3066-3482(+)